MIKTLALVLKKQNLGETDRILTIFTPVLGKKRVVVQAIRKPLSKLAGHLDTFMVSQVMLTERSEMPRLTGAVLVESFENLRGTLQGIERASKVTRLIERVIIEDIPQQAIFQISLDALTRIDLEESWPAVWLTFLFSIANELGLAPKDLVCQGCGKSLKQTCWWQIEERQFFCHNCLGSSRRAISLEENSLKLIYLLNCKPYKMIRQLNIPDKCAAQVEQILLREITQWFNKPWMEYASLA
jgi:DNA repair protein RecO (recombination protein O)